jgi:hypothetical protein
LFFFPLVFFAVQSLLEWAERFLDEYDGTSLPSWMAFRSEAEKIYGDGCMTSVKKECQLLLVKRSRQNPAPSVGYFSS